MPPRPRGLGWSEVELESAVDAYLEMLESELAGADYSKAGTRRRYLAGPLTGRSVGSFEYRMQNISAVLDELGLPRIQGYLPASQVGAEVSARIRAILTERDTARFRDYEPTADRDELERKVSRLLSQGVPRPEGTRAPETASATGTVFRRSPAVAAWVRSAAEGRCEACGDTAPFFTSDGVGFLEVHHVRPLADGGSDTVENAVAVCPNCHRALHHADDAVIRTGRLLAGVSRLAAE